MIPFPPPRRLVNVLAEETALLASVVGVRAPSDDQDRGHARSPPPAPLGLLQAMFAYAQPRGLPCGFAGIKQRLLRALESVGECVREIEPAKLISRGDGPMSGYFYRHADPVIPPYWLTDEVVPPIERRSRGRTTPGCSGGRLARLGRFLTHRKDALRPRPHTACAPPPAIQAPPPHARFPLEPQAQ